MNHDIDGRDMVRLTAVIPPYTTWPPMPAPVSLDEHFPWHRIRRLPRK